MIIALGLIFFTANLLFGSVHIPIGEFFNGSKNTILQFRFEEAIIATIAGASLSIGGLFMQTLFRNPLAGPSVLGISSGASLGVAIALLLFGSVTSGILPFYAIAGAIGFLFILLLISFRVKQSVTLLIVGLLLGYGISALISLLEFFTQAESLKKYIIWGMGSFFPSSSTTYWFMFLLNLPVIFLSFLMLKPLDAMLLGESHAQSLGVNTKRTRLLLILITGFLSGVVTAYCGPIAFIGLMVPHLARFLFKTSAHKILLPAVIIIGSSLALIANLIARLPGTAERIPVNIICSVLGIPVIIWIILEQRKTWIVS